MKRLEPAIDGSYLTHTPVSGTLALRARGRGAQLARLGGERMSTTPHSSGEIALLPDHATILLVEDDADTCHFYAEALRRSGFVVRQATDGYAAIEQLNEAVPDVVVSDLRMPRMGGMALLHALRSDPVGRDVPYVVLSATSDADTRIACLDSGATDVLTKPIDTRELAVRLQLHVRQARERQRLREQSYIDELTGLYNRRGTMEALDRELSRTSRTTAPLAVLAIDVDEFKAINDTHGHGAGDDVLAAIAGAILGAVRASDTVGRMGGDEMLVVLPNVSEMLANSIAYRIHQNVAELRIRGISSKLSVSIGVAVDATGRVPSSELLARADVDMYRHKRRGRTPSLKAL